MKYAKYMQLISYLVSEIHSSGYAYFLTTKELHPYLEKNLKKLPAAINRLITLLLFKELINL